MQLVRLIVLGTAGFAALAGYIQEGRRLAAIRQMPGDKARDFYEAVRARDERLMWVVAALLAVGAAALTIRELFASSAAAGV